MSGVAGPVAVHPHPAAPADQDVAGLQILNAERPDYQDRSAYCCHNRLYAGGKVGPNNKILKLALLTINFKNVLGLGITKKNLSRVRGCALTGRLNARNIRSDTGEFRQ